MRSRLSKLILDWNYRSEYYSPTTPRFGNNSVHASLYISEHLSIRYVSRMLVQRIYECKSGDKKRRVVCSTCI